MLNHLIFDGDPATFGVAEIAVLLVLATLAVWLLFGTAAWPRMRKITGVALALAGAVFLVKQALL